MKISFLGLFLVPIVCLTAWDDDKRSDNDRRDQQFDKTRDICQSEYDWSKLERDGNSGNDRSDTDERQGTLSRPGDSKD